VEGIDERDWGGVGRERGKKNRKPVKKTLVGRERWGLRAASTMNGQKREGRGGGEQDVTGGKNTTNGMKV